MCECPLSTAEFITGWLVKITGMPYSPLPAQIGYVWYYLGTIFGRSMSHGLPIGTLEKLA